MGNRRFWSVVMISVIAVLVLNTLAGTAQSPLERALHVGHVPTWLPLVLAAAVGVALGPLLNRRRGTAPEVRGAPAAGARRGADRERPATRGRHAVPRAVRRERERQARRGTNGAPAAAAPGKESAASPPPKDQPPRGERRRATGVPGKQGPESQPSGGPEPPPAESAATLAVGPEDGSAAGGDPPGTAPDAGSGG